MNSYGPMGSPGLCVWLNMAARLLLSLGERARLSVTKDTIGMLLMVPEIKVMITDNIVIHGKVTNGCMGVLQDVKYKSNDVRHR